MASTMFFAAFGACIGAIVLVCSLVELWRYCRSGEYEREPWAHVYF